MPTACHAAIASAYALKIHGTAAPAPDRASTMPRSPIAIVRVTIQYRRAIRSRRGMPPSCRAGVGRVTT